jgi:hypothetical protein
VYDIVSEEQLLAKELGSGPFYVSSKADSFSVWYFILTLALLGGGLLIWFNRKSSNTVTLTGTELKRGNKVILLDDELSFLLKSLLNKGGEIWFSELDALFKNSNLSDAQKLKDLRIVISELNFKLNSFLEIKKNSVSVSRGTKDRRTRSIRLNVSPLKLIVNE